VADDEPLARRRLVRFLRAEPDVDDVVEVGGGRDAVAALEAGDVDLVLLDVQMPDLDGFGVLAAFGPERAPPVIFVTAFDAYALRAFEVHAFDYLLKPVNADRFRAAMARARTHLEQVTSASAGRRLRGLLAQLLAADADPAALGERGGERTGERLAERPRFVDRISVTARDRTVFVPVSDVDWFEADGNYVRVHAGRATHVIRETLSALEASLQPDRFVRIHRGTIVNVDRIRELQPWFAGDQIVILKDGRQLRLSRTYRERLFERMQALR
jgi:two-component system LytT family response regulator